MPYIYSQPFTTYSISSLFHKGMNKFNVISKININSIDLTLVSYTLLIIQPIPHQDYYERYENEIELFNSLLYYLHNNDIALLISTINSTTHLKEYYIIMSDENNINEGLIMRIPSAEQVLYHKTQVLSNENEYNKELIEYIIIIL